MIKINRINQDKNLNTITEMIYELLKEEGLTVKVMNSEETKLCTTNYAGLECFDYDGKKFSVSIGRYYDRNGNMISQESEG